MFEDNVMDFKKEESSNKDDSPIFAKTKLSAKEYSRRKKHSKMAKKSRKINRKK